MRRHWYLVVLALLVPLMLHAMHSDQCEFDVSPMKVDLHQAEVAVDRSELELARELVARWADKDPNYVDAWLAIESLAVARDPASTDAELRYHLSRARRFANENTNRAVMELAARIPDHASLARERFAADRPDAWALAAVARVEPDSMRRAELLSRCHARVPSASSICGEALPRPVSKWEATMLERAPIYGMLLVSLGCVLALMIGRWPPARPVLVTRVVVVAAVVFAIAKVYAFPYFGPLCVFVAAWVHVYASRWSFVAHARSSPDLRTRRATAEDLALPRVEISGWSERIETIVRAPVPCSPYREISREEPVALIIQRRWSLFPALTLVAAIAAVVASIVT